MRKTIYSVSVYGECWFTRKFYFKHGGSQNATLTVDNFVEIFHTMFDQGYVPEELKIANVVQNFQKENGTLISNYRSISR